MGGWVGGWVGDWVGGWVGGSVAPAAAVVEVLCCHDEQHAWQHCLLSHAPLHFPPACPPCAHLQRGLAVTDRIGLLGASVTQHPEFEQLLDWLMQPERAHVRLRQAHCAVCLAGRLPAWLASCLPACSYRFWVITICKNRPYTIHHGMCACLPAVLPRCGPTQ